MQSIDASRWPMIAAVPGGAWLRRRARKAEAEFALACQRAGMELEGAEPDVIVNDDALFIRVADAGWLGLAESYMAGEWSAADLPRVLALLLVHGYNPKSKASGLDGVYEEGDQLALLNLISTDGISDHAPLFTTGVPTTQRQAIRGPHGREHFIDDTLMGEPAIVERDDLAAGQLRAVEMLLDAGEVHGGSYVAEFPAAGGLFALAAQRRRAIVDALTSNPEHSAHLRDLFEAADVDGGAHPLLVSAPLSLEPDCRNRYEVVGSVGQLERMDADAKQRYLRSVEQMVVPGGALVMLTTVGTEVLRTRTLDVMRAYVAPGYEVGDMPSLHRLVEGRGRLKIESVTHIGSHAVEGLRLQRELFATRHREAAAEGFDAVYRRLWDYQMSMREALYRVGALDCVAVVARSR